MAKADDKHKTLSVSSRADILLDTAAFGPSTRRDCRKVRVSPRKTRRLHRAQRLHPARWHLVAHQVRHPVPLYQPVLTRNRNCAFYTQAHQAILTPESDTVIVPPSDLRAPGVDALQYILLPLAGPEEFDLDTQERLPEALQFLPPTKKREANAAFRLTHVETLLLLCTTRWGRDYLRTHGVYEVVRALHEQETNDAVSEHVERLVNVIQRAEGPETAQDLQVEEIEDDDDDMRIEEV